MTETRTTIVELFKKHLIASGYEGLSLTALATEAGMRKPSLYHHFPGGKDELFEAAALSFIADQHAAIGRALDVSAGLSRQLEDLARVCANAVSRTSTLEQRLFDGLDRVDEAVAMRVRAEYGQNILAPVEQCFAHWVASGELEGDPEFLMLCFLHMARALEMAGEPEDAANLVSLFLNGARRT